MPSNGPWSRTFLGAPPEVAGLTLNGITTYAMAGINVGWCLRFMARDSRDVAGFWVNWSSVSVPGTITGRIETIDAATGKPTGTLYDTNATIAFTPAVGWQNPTFATLPTTGLVAGVEYALLLLTTGAGTTQTLRGYMTGSPYSAFPAVVLTAAVGTVRSNFAEVAGAPLGVATLVFEDGSEEADGMLGAVAGSNFAIYGTRAWGMKLTLTSTLTLRGVTTEAITIGGTPGDVRCRILDSNNALVTNASVTADKDSMSTGSANRRWRLYFPAVVTLPPGVYRVILDQTDTTTTSGNNYQCRAGTYRAVGLIPSATIRTDTIDVTIGSPVWTDTNTDWPAMQLMIDDIPNRAYIQSGLRTGGRM